MVRFILVFLLTGILALCFSQASSPGKNNLTRLYGLAEKKFQQAESFSARAGDDERSLARADSVYNQALREFKELLPAIEDTGNDSLSLFTRFRVALISHYLGETAPAKSFFLSGITLKPRLPQVPDSILFLPYLYTGGIYYSQNGFDSALYYYKKAESVQDRYLEPLDGAERLYNRLGVMLYETGNYQQARNYFEKAIALTPSSATSLIANYRLNIASILIKLEEYEAARMNYERILPSGFFLNEIMHNLGIINLKLNDPGKGLSFFRRVHYPDDKKNIDLFYNFAIAYSGLKENDSAAFYYQKALAENLKWNGSRKNVQHGLILKYKADELAGNKQFKEAISLYQQALMQFDNSFTDADPLSNPAVFTGVYSYINLFNTLTAKGVALENLYKSGKKMETLKASLDTYRAAYKLADYVERTYDSDEARLFLNKIKQAAHSRPIEISLLLYRLTGKKTYLEEAYLFDQRNKASVLSLNMQENKARITSRENNELFSQESLLRSTITRLSLQHVALTDSNLLAESKARIRDAEIALGRIQEDITNNSDKRDLLYQERIPAVHELQKRLDNKTAILSWHLSVNELLVLVITGNKFTYHVTPIGPGFFQTIDSFKTSLYYTQGEQRYMGNNLARNLYNILIGSIRTHLVNVDRLVIIPDDELNYLPFEALQDTDQNYLVEKFAIQYQFSTGLFGMAENKGVAPGILAVAPFSSSPFADSSGSELSILPASTEEISGLDGMILLDSLGTKQNFMKAADHYGIIHLATHASVNNLQPDRSFIAFYSSVPEADNKLYAREIYDMQLDSTELIILSACETGAGQLVKGEGLMSLSRAFAYAGCPNIITSLWKAEDKATSFLTRRLHYYMDKKMPKDRALQNAKKDLLNNEEIDPRYKSPNYWAHLIFIGDYKREHSRTLWGWIAGGLILVSVVYLIFKRRKRKSWKY